MAALRLAVVLRHEHEPDDSPRAGLGHDDESRKPRVCFVRDLHDIVGARLGVCEVLVELVGRMIQILHRRALIFCSSATSATSITLASEIGSRRSIPVAIHPRCMSVSTSVLRRAYASSRSLTVTNPFREATTGTPCSPRRRRLASR